MAFQSLPNELLFMIAGLLRRTDLNALIQTCQLFHSVLNRTLYSNNIRHNHSSALFWAASTGNCGTIQLMIASGADLQIRAETAAVTQQSLNRLKSFNIPRNRSSINTRQARNATNSSTFSACGETPLHRASQRNQEAVVRFLLDSGGDMLSIDRNGYYPVQLAAQQGHESVVKLFLEKGFHPNTLSWASYDPSALHSAVCGGHSGIVTLLLHHGANASQKKSGFNTDASPLDLALAGYWFPRTQNIQDLQNALGPEHIRSGHGDCALLLIEHATQLETLEENGYLVHAAREKYVKVVKVLVDLGIDPNVRLYGRTALGYAKIYRCKELMDLLEPLTSPAPKPKRKKRKTES